MAWRPTEYLIEGMLDNTKLGQVTGWMKFAGKGKEVVFNLKGDFHRDIRGCRIQFTGDGEQQGSMEYMEGICIKQTGKVGDITAGLPTGEYEGNPTYEYVDYPYIEWYSDNGRVVIELDSEDIIILGKPIPVRESDPIDREDQNRNMENFLQNMFNESKNLDT